MTTQLPGIEELVTDGKTGLLVRPGDVEALAKALERLLATKLEAFHGRGKNDFRGSHDLEDIMTVIDGRPELVGEVHLAPTNLQKYLSGEFGALVSNRDFLDALPGHLLPDSASQQRAGFILARMKQMILQG